MSIALRDLWPDDIQADDVLTPREILVHQAEQLESRTNGLLIGHVPVKESEDRVILGFDVAAPRAQCEVRLFEVQHRTEFEYPAAILPPDERLPKFLRERYYHESPGDIARIALAQAEVVGKVLGSGKWVENEWIATSPTEFSDKVGKVLASPSVKARVLSLISRSQAFPSSNNGENEPAN